MFYQAPSKKAGKKAAAPKKSAGGAGKVAKVCGFDALKRSLYVNLWMSTGRLERGLQEEASRRV